MRRSALTVQESGSRVPFLDRLRPEQIHSDSEDGVGELVDQWGRSHAVDSVAILGRDAGAAAITVGDDSVSRRHAELAYDPTDHTWLVRDLGSANGTYVDGRRIPNIAIITDRQLLSVGDISFVFLARPRRRSGGPWSFARLRGGGSYIECGGARAQLDIDQTACLALLITRQNEDEQLNRSAALRGFVRAAELHSVAGGPLVRERAVVTKRVLRGVESALSSVGIHDAIEVHERLGTRLRTASRPQQ